MANFVVDAYNLDRTEIEQQFSLTPKDATAAALAPLSATSPVGTIVSGALPTAALSSGVGAQLSTTRDVNAYIAITNTATGGTAAIALSPDNVTYSTVATVASAINASVTLVTVRVPAGWYLKVTATNATITSTTYA
jgi:hypothetical protein